MIQKGFAFYKIKSKRRKKKQPRLKEKRGNDKEIEKKKCKQLEKEIREIESSQGRGTERRCSRGTSIV